MIDSHCCWAVDWNPKARAACRSVGRLLCLVQNKNVLRYFNFCFENSGSEYRERE